MSAGSGVLGVLLPGLTLWQREMVRFLRQRDRVVGALVTPVVFWALLGLGLGKSFQTTFQASDHGYLEYFYAGTLLMILLFTAIFSTISVIEDRREGFLQAVLVAPVGHFSLVIGKLFGGASLAVLQGAIFLALAPAVHLPIAWAAVPWLAGVMILLAVALTGLGFALAWRMESAAGYHAVMSLFLLPLWFLSGAVFPPAGAPVWLGWLMKGNPLWYGLAALRHGLYWNRPEMTADVPGPVVALTVTAVFAVAMFGLSAVLARRTTKGDLQ
ncbi:ABC transporter permease [bacterium]|nr:ABC transporter permease [bacterium]